MDFFDALPDYSTELYCHKKMKTNEENSLEALNAVLPVLEALPEWTYDVLHDALIGLAQKLELKNGRILWPVRTALSGKAVTPWRRSGAVPHPGTGGDALPHSGRNPPSVRLRGGLTGFFPSETHNTPRLTASAGACVFFVCFVFVESVIPGSRAPGR